LIYYEEIMKKDILIYTKTLHKQPNAKYEKWQQFSHVPKLYCANSPILGMKPYLYKFNNSLWGATRSLKLFPRGKEAYTETIEILKFAMIILYDNKRISFTKHYPTSLMSFDIL